MTIGLALSGGGTRAAVFHLGVLRRLAASDLLENVSQISTVSSGSLLMSSIFSQCELTWPFSDQFLTTVYPSLRKLLTSIDLFSLKAILKHPNLWHLIPLRRSAIVASLLEKRWGTSGNLSDLPDIPTWTINTTCIETGKNWRFSKYEMGDWKFGKHFNPPFPIATAAAASAAVPYVLGGLAFELPIDGWFDTNPATGEPTDRKAAPNRRVRLWDGGAYESLGIEPLFKPDSGMADCDDIVVSDASAPLANLNHDESKGSLLSGNLQSPRLFDVTSDQIRSLRSRMFIEGLISKKAVGAFIRMGNSVRELDIKTGRKRDASEYEHFLSDEETSLALRFPTNLSAVPPVDFERIARHGYECTDATLTAYRSDLALKTMSWPDI